MLNIIALDVESTDVGKTAQVIELGYIHLSYNLSELSYTKDDLVGDIVNELTLYSYEERFRPTVPIKLDASKVHGIYLKDLFGCRRPSEITLPENLAYVVGHNLIFDYRLLKQSNPNLNETLDNIKPIDTMVLAKTLNKNLKLGFESVKLDYLVKHFYPDNVENLIAKDHAALGDCIKCVLVLIKLLEYIPHITTWDGLYEFQKILKKPVKPKKEIKI